jgi:hypothetical protein
MQRTRQELEEARKAVTNRMSGVPKDSEVWVLLAGMSTALQWACKDEQGPGAMSALIDEWRINNALSDM